MKTYKCIQCFIILLRPVMLRSFASAISGEVDDAISDRTVELCSQCLTMARHNLSILDSLRQIDRIGTFPESFCTIHN